MVGGPAGPNPIPSIAPQSVTLFVRHIALAAWLSDMEVPPHPVAPSPRCTAMSIPRDVWPFGSALAPAVALGRRVMLYPLLFQVHLLPLHFGPFHRLAHPQALAA